MQWRGGVATPNGDTVIRRLKNQKTTALNELNRFNEELVVEGKRRGWFRRPVNVAIDEWGREYYGKNRDINCTGGKHKNGTNFFHTVMTISVVESGKRLELAMVPMSLFRSKEKAVEQLIDAALRHVRIRKVLLDRGFNSIGVIRVLESKGVRYLMPMSRNERVKREIQQTVGLEFRVVHDYQFRLLTRQRVTLVIWCPETTDVATTKSYVAYITNLPICPDRISIMALAEHYRARWGIETGYRVKKWEFRAKTCSESTMVRFFLIHLAIILFNVWTLLRHDRSEFGKNGLPAYLLADEFVLAITTPTG
jgi:IS4 transposase